MTKLDSLFVVNGSMGSDAPPDISGLVGMYAQGNEPNHHIPYLYAFAGYQWKSAEKIAHIARELYTAGVDGLCGNDDAGQMSAWYVMSAARFLSRKPLQRHLRPRDAAGAKGRATDGRGEALHHGNRQLRSQEYLYPTRDARWGEPYHEILHIDFHQIRAGSTLRLFMGDKPNLRFGAAPADRPPSSPPLEIDPEHIHDRPTLPIGAPAPDFALPGVDGKTYTLSSFNDAKVLVVVFMCNHCPTSQAYEQRIIRLTREYAGRGVRVVAISPNAPSSLRLDELGYSDVGDGFEEMKTRAGQAGYNFPYLYDGELRARLLGGSKQFGPARFHTACIHLRPSAAFAIRRTLRRYRRPFETPA